jgi:hypothetical protein
MQAVATNSHNDAGASKAFNFTTSRRGVKSRQYKATNRVGLPLLANRDGIGSDGWTHIVPKGELKNAEAGVTQVPVGRRSSCSPMRSSAPREVPQIFEVLRSARASPLRSG